MEKMLRRALRKIGYELVRYGGGASSSAGKSPNQIIEPKKDACELPADCDDFEKSTILQVKPYTMTSPERIVSLIHSVQYVLDNKIEGSFVECGVWKGGSTMAAALTFLENESTDKDLYLFDTFEGMTAASDADISISGEVAVDLMSKTKKKEEDHLWAYSPLEKVRDAVYSTGYPQGKIHFIKGMVEHTVPDKAPSRISILRLDTDWYESTRHELIYLFPRLSKGGVLIIDDYGHWKGARKAVDEYIKSNKIKILLNRIDYTGRIAVKLCH